MTEKWYVCAHTQKPVCECVIVELIDVAVPIERNVNQEIFDTP
jgi:hypothetical protein